jgi:hypothetical protein
LSRMMLMFDCIFECMKFPVFLLLIWPLFLTYFGKPIMLMASHSLVMIVLSYAIWESVNMHNSGMLHCQHFAAVCHGYSMLQEADLSHKSHFNNHPLIIQYIRCFFDVLVHMS